MIDLRGAKFSISYIDMKACSVGWMAVHPHLRETAYGAAMRSANQRTIGMIKPTTKTAARIGGAALAAALFGFLAASVWYASRAWTSVDAPPLPAQGYVAMILGVVFSVVLGGGLMALVFYSSRYGYDEEANRDQHPAGADDPEIQHTHEPGLR
jgi:hypothetical protein